MALIKHIANLLALWTIPYIIVLFFLLVTGFAFVYQDAISSTPFIITYSIYFLMMFIIYASIDDNDSPSFQLFKTN